jgi:hypothetical protein
MMQDPLRDIILLQADFLSSQAVMFDKMAANGEPRLVLEQRLKTAARQCRERAELLNDVLAQTEPKAGAKAP